MMRFEPSCLSIFVDVNALRLYGCLCTQGWVFIACPHTGVPEIGQSTNTQPCATMVAHHAYFSVSLFGDYRQNVTKHEGDGAYAERSISGTPV